MLRDFIPTLASAALCVVVTGCSSSAARVSVDPILDVNPSSVSHDQVVHPDDYRGKVSAWYFGHAT
jgi:hypothetical protein